MTKIQEVIKAESELREEIKQQVKEARKRIIKGEFILNESILKEFQI